MNDKSKPLRLLPIDVVAIIFEYSKYKTCQRLLRLSRGSRKIFWTTKIKEIIKKKWEELLDVFKSMSKDTLDRWLRGSEMTFGEKVDYGIKIINDYSWSKTEFIYEDGATVRFKDVGPDPDKLFYFYLMQCIHHITWKTDRERVYRIKEECNKHHTRSRNGKICTSMWTFEESSNHVRNCLYDLLKERCRHRVEQELLWEAHESTPKELLASGRLMRLKFIIEKMGIGDPCKIILALSKQQNRRFGKSVSLGLIGKLKNSR